MEEVEVILQYGQHMEKACLTVTNLGQQTIIIGHLWLTHHNPEVDWAHQSVTMSQCPPECQGRSNGGMAEDDGPEPGDAIYAAFIPPEWVEHHIRATNTPSQQLAQEAQKAEVSRPLEDMVPAQYHDFRDVFSKEAFDELPPRKVWDHAIDLSPGTELPRSWTFPLSPTEQKELDDFLQENLVNGCICPSKSPMGAPVFFVKKKDGLLRLVQDYQKLNEIMVKNSYPLPLVSDVLTCLCNTEFFTVLDLHWGFNNVWIKEGDEWKAAFQTNQGLFEPTVMFFRLCNSVMTSSPGDRKALRGQQTWAQPLGWPLSHWVCWVVSEMVCVRVHLRPGTYHVLVLTELQQICGTGAQGDGSLLNALSRKCYMHTLQYVHRGTLP